MITIPAGKFMMGAEGWGEFESPKHEVNLDAFLMDEAPVTNSEFAAFINDTGYKTQAEIAGSAQGYNEGKYVEIKGLNWRTYFTEERKDHPVVLVSWHDADAYAKWAGKRLPTEAEWERAARGNLVELMYPWGDESPTADSCNFSKETFDFPATTPVKSFAPNSFGLFDMGGNVWNWCSDWFDKDYYSSTEKNNPNGPGNGTTKVRRGGAFNVIQPFRLRNSNRGAFFPEKSAINIGFRCAKNLL